MSSGGGGGASSSHVVEKELELSDSKESCGGNDLTRPITEDMADAVDLDHTFEIPKTRSRKQIPNYNHLISDPRMTNHPDRHNRVLGGHREATRIWAGSWPWISLQLAAIIFDILNTLCAVARETLQEDAHCAQQRFRSKAQWGVYPIYVADIVLRIYAFGLLYFRKTRNVVDLFIVIVSLFASLYREFGLSETEDPSVMILLICRLLRAGRVGLLFNRTIKRCCISMRHITGKGKARLIDPVNDIDLDLIYITPRLIAMSVPANGWITSLYRNPLSEVVEFMELEHAGHYLIVNLCPEHPYPEERFRTGHVIHYKVQDHMPPDTPSMFKFLADAREFLDDDPSNVMAVHCRGGKGRTGTFCALWLYYDYETLASLNGNIISTPTYKRRTIVDVPAEPNIKVCMETFEFQRTDINPLSKDFKLQGIETPSQVRFCTGVAGHLARHNLFYPDELGKVPSKWRRLQRLEAVDFFVEPLQDELVVIVQALVGMRTLFVSKPAVGSWSLEDFRLDGDIRISLAKPGHELEWGTLKKRAGKEPGCLFLFVFHTAFLPERQLQLEMSQVDQACKKRNLYKESGRLVLSYSDESSASPTDCERERERLNEYTVTGCI